MQGNSQVAAIGQSAVFGRAFIMAASVWLVAQAHHGVFLGDWSDDASLPGNACWLLILYCQLRLTLDWLAILWRQRRATPDFLLQILCVAIILLAARAAGDPLASPIFGQLMFFAQPLIVLFGFAALHRRQPLRA